MILNTRTHSPSQDADPARESGPLTRLQAALSRRLEKLATEGTEDERLVVARLPRVANITAVLAWLRESGGGLELVETLRYEAQELWRKHRPDDRAVELAALLFLVGAEGRLLETLGANGNDQEHLHLSVDDQTSAAILGLCLLNRGVHFQVDFDRAMISARNLVSDFEVREPGKDTGQAAMRRGIASVERAITGRKPGDGLGPVESVEALRTRLRLLDKRQDIRLAVAVRHGDPAGALTETGARDVLQTLDVPVFFYAAEPDIANVDSSVLAEIEGDMRGHLRDLLESMEPRAGASATSGTSSRPLVFFSYSHERDDEHWNNNLIAQLRGLEVLGKIELWVDVRKIGAGHRWNDKIQSAMDRADVAVLMISKHFMNSVYIRQHELPPLLRAHQDGRLRLVPVLLGACSWEEDTELGPLQLATGTIPLNNRIKVGDLDRETAKIAKLVLGR